MLGATVGQVTSAHLQYDDEAQRMLTSVTLQIDPSRIEIVHRRAAPAARARARAATTWLQAFARGLRETGGARPARARDHGEFPHRHQGGRARPGARRAAGAHRAGGRLCAAAGGGSTEIADILASVKSVLHHVDALTTGPALGARDRRTRSHARQSRPHHRRGAAADQAAHRQPARHLGCRAADAAGGAAHAGQRRRRQLRPAAD
jgi:hypothetical protein